MPAIVALAEARGTSSMVVVSAPMRRLACSTSFSPAQFHDVIRQAREPRSVQLEKIRRPCAIVKSISAALTSTGARPSSDMNHCGWALINSRSSRSACAIDVGLTAGAAFAGDIARYANIEPSMKSVYLAGAVRTPIGKFGGSLAPQSAADLGVAAARESLARAQ